MYTITSLPRMATEHGSEQHMMERMATASTIEEEEDPFIVLFSVLSVETTEQLCARLLQAASRFASPWGITSWFICGRTHQAIRL